jgi:hypothetical protein
MTEPPASAAGSSCRRAAFEGGAGYEMFATGVKQPAHSGGRFQVEIRFTHKERLRDHVHAWSLSPTRGFSINPFKSHPWTTVTFSMKNHIGIQDDRHSPDWIINGLFNEKVADLSTSSCSLSLSTLSPADAIFRSPSIRPDHRWQPPGGA